MCVFPRWHTLLKTAVIGTKKKNEKEKSVSLAIRLQHYTLLPLLPTLKDAVATGLYPELPIGSKMSSFFVTNSYTFSSKISTTSYSPSSVRLGLLRSWRSTRCLPRVKKKNTFVDTSKGRRWDRPQSWLSSVFHWHGLGRQIQIWSRQARRLSILLTIAGKSSPAALPWYKMHTLTLL